MKGHKDKGAVVATGSGIVVGSGKSNKHIWRFAGLVALVVVLSLGAGVGVRLIQQHAKNKQTKVDITVDKAQNLSISGDYDQSTKEIQQALKSPGLTSGQKYSLYLQQGVTYENQQKYADAITAYKQADAANPTQGIAESIARVAALAGDKSTAIAYYQKAIMRIPADSPVRSDAKAMYQQKIKDLGGKP